MTQPVNVGSPVVDFSVISISLEDWPATIDALARLFMVAWDRSPPLVATVMAAIMFLPYYWLWLRRNVVPVEIELNQFERAAWDTLDLKSKRKKKGKKK